MERLIIAAASLALYSTQLFADDAALLKAVTGRQSAAIASLNSVAIEFVQTIGHFSNEGSERTILAERHGLLVWFPKTGKSLDQQISESGTHRTSLLFRKPRTLFDSLESDGKGFEPLFTAYLGKPDTKVEAVQNGVRLSFAMNKGSKPTHWMSYTFDDRYSYFPTLFEVRTGQNIEDSKLTQKETREFAVHDGITYPTLIERITYHQRGEISSTVKFRIRRISMNLESHKSISHSGEVTEFALFGTNSPVGQKESFSDQDQPMSAAQGTMQGLEMGDRVYLLASGELAQKCIQLTGLEPPKGDVGCYFVCTVEGLGADNYKLMGSRLFANHGQRLNASDDRRLLTIVATIQSKDLLPPRLGLDPNDARPLAVQREIEKMPRVHLTSLNDVKVSCWALVEETGILTKAFQSAN